MKNTQTLPILISILATLFNLTLSTNPQQQTHQSNTPLLQEDLRILSGNIQRPNGITWFNNNIYTSCTGDWTIYQINDTTGSTITYTYGIQNANTLYIEESEQGSPTIWAPDNQTNSLIQIGDNRTPNPIITGLDSPWGIATLNNTFLITNYNANNTIQTTRNGAEIRTITELHNPTGITTDEEHIYIANSSDPQNAIIQINTDNLTEDNNTQPQKQTLLSGIQNITNLTTAADHNLYFTYTLGNRGVIGRINPSICQTQGGCTNTDIEIVLYSELAAPLAGLTLSPDMRLFIHTIYEPNIYWTQIES